MSSIADDIVKFSANTAIRKMQLPEALIVKAVTDAHQRLVARETAPPTIIRHIAIASYEYSVTAFSARSEDALYEKIANFCRDNWNDAHNPELIENVDTAPDRAIVAAYYDNNTDEGLDITEIEDTLDEPIPTTGQNDLYVVLITDTDEQDYIFAAIGYEDARTVLAEWICRQPGFTKNLPSNPNLIGSYFKQANTYYIISPCSPK